MTSAAATAMATPTGPTATATSGIGDISPLDLAVSIRIAFAERDDRAESWEDTTSQITADDTTLYLLHALKDYPVARWKALVMEAGADPILLASLSWCRDFTWKHLIEAAGENILDAAPFSAAAAAAGFVRTGWDNQSIGLSQIVALRAPETTIAFLGAAVADNLVLDLSGPDLARLGGAKARLAAWLMLKNGDVARHADVLRTWTNGTKAPDLAFWAGFALMTRDRRYHDRVGDFLAFAGHNPVLKTYAEALIKAVALGPLTVQSARKTLANACRGLRRDRLTNALRLAAFAPADTPLYDPFAALPRQAASLKRLHALIGGDAFAAALTAEAQAARAMADRRSGKRAPQATMTPRGWAETDLTDLTPLAGTLTGDDGCRARLFVQPRTNRPLVKREEDGEFLHFGRPVYLYACEKDGVHRYIGADPAMAAPPPRPDDLIQIYIRLLNEGVDVRRPVLARQLDAEKFVIMPQQTRPADEAWEFHVTAYVRCRAAIAGNRRILIATGIYRD